MRIFKNAWFERFARKQGITDEALRQAIQRAEQGLIDADLGGGVIKQRVARQGQGKSGGWRTLILFRQAERAVFAFGFAKNKQANFSPADEALLKQAAAQILAWSDAQLDRLVQLNEMTEIEHEQEN